MGPAAVPRTRSRCVQERARLVDLAVSHTEGPIGTATHPTDPIEHDMAPTSAWTLVARLGVVAALAAGCTGTPSSQTEVADGTAPPPTTPSTQPPAASEQDTTPDTNGLPAPPDLSGNTIHCDAVEGPCDHGDDPDLDMLWDACADGAGGACDRLYYDSGFDTRYEQFGNTCGDRGLTIPCPEELDS